MAIQGDPYPVRRSPRLVGFDYRSSGAYFVTICAAGRRELFGHADGNGVRLTRTGAIVAEELVRAGTLGTSVTLDAFVVMPNHVHAIFVLGSASEIRIGAVVNLFKGAVTRRVRGLSGNAGLVWQRGYHERIVRDDRDLEAMREYIAANPAGWAEDRENDRRGRD